ncbi:ribonuclease P protein subunit p21-like [Thrips palmi]|uniref:Ribonuclease P protein subunit p21-like n=1 Tax=Thrips palmi TaxID=161013 RepID=A0A6P8ZYC7_THRPL|nr:ribonuclease P protein subunit p21-like [Thrips palmi]
MTEGKMNKKGAKCFPGKESFQRMNFLYQAAHVTLAKDHKNCDIPAYFGNSMVSIARKSVLRMEPSIKREFCKGCNSLLKSGLTARIRIRSGNMICTCLRCGTVKRFPTKRQYKLWSECDDACLEILDESTGIEKTEFSQNEATKSKSLKPEVKVLDEDKSEALKEETTVSIAEGR